ncbi:MAG TPA: DUF1707 domain-containing protein [Pseudonocardiaceae bacterium]|jgi:Flp pilus assembly protein TadB|nr:DUF1707 domain-containing protein [Pseudonocardiaceae bacterium]
MDNTGNADTGIRASDAERERYAGIVQAATGDGRLSTHEADERLAAIYAVRFRHELDSLVRDLPKPEQPATRVPVSWRRGPLAVHAGIVAVIAVLLMVKWIVVGAFFFPVIPLVWLGVSLLVHARIRRVRGSIRAAAPAAP